ncbi:hypothetical protein Tco_0944189, partial [Tanacetum coccineum]
MVMMAWRRWWRLLWLASAGGGEMVVEVAVVGVMAAEADIGDDDTELVSKEESEISEQGMSDNIDNDKPLAPKPQHEELIPEEDLDEWLKTEMEKRMVRQDKKSKKDALIYILKSLGGSIVTVKEEGDISGTLWYQLPPKELNPGSFTLPCTIGEDLFSYESPSCLQFEQRSRFCDDESIDTVDSNDEMQEPEDGHKKVKNFEKITSRWHVCKPVRVFYDNECGKDCGMWPTYNPDLSFCSGYDAIYGKGENGMLEQWMCFWDHERKNIRGNRMTFTDFPKVRYGSKSIDDTTHERRYYEWIAQNTEFEDDGIPKETIKYDNHCKYHHEYPHSYFPEDKTKPWKPSFNNDKTPRDQENTSQNLFCQKDPISNIKTYFPDFSQTQPIKPRPKDYSFEEWLKIKLEHTNTRDDPYSTRFNEYKEEFDNKIELLGNEYDLRVGRK